MSIQNLHAILRMQSPNGAFPSYVHIGERVIKDENCFVTALVLLHLLDYSAVLQDKKLFSAIDRGLDFIEACEQPGEKGSFCFYPYTIQSQRLDIFINPDLDDSSLALLVLLKGKRRSEEEVLTAIKKVIEPNRLLGISGHQGQWIAPGSFLTWINTPISFNTIDCCVNCNIVSLYTYLNLKTHDSYKAAVATINRATTLYSADISSMRRIAPFYPDPVELLFALDRAVKAGAEELQNALNHWKKKHSKGCYLKNKTDTSQYICCHESGKPVWSSPVLQKIRAITASLHTSFFETNR
jgi:hypothetical protein